MNDYYNKYIKYKKKYIYLKNIVGGYNKIYEYDNINNFINAYNNHLIKFPYKSLYYTNSDIHNLFNNLKKYNYNERIINRKYKLKKIKLAENQMLFEGKYTILLSKNEDYLDFNILSDMFNEYCRIKCHIKYNLSPLQYFHKYIKELGEKCLKKYQKITPHNLRETLYENVKECTSHRPTNIVSMIQIFKSKSVIDISAGWGDRLIGAISMDCKYLGVDPNECLQSGYNKIINFFSGDHDKYKILVGEFETIDLPNEKFDLCYTSPPYFDLEIYTNAKNQSIKYNNEDLWYENFLKISIKKAWEYINTNGIMAININHESKKNTYIYKMIELINNFSDSKYLGLISYGDEYLHNPQPIWIWKKI